MATGTRTGCNVKFEAYIDGEWTEIYGLYYTEHINFTPKRYVEDEDTTTPENGGQPRATNNLWNVVEYDTSNSMYILKLKDVLPIHFRCRITVQNIGSTKANISTQIVGRELLDNFHKLTMSAYEHSTYADFVVIINTINTNYG